MDINLIFSLFLYSLVNPEQVSYADSSNGTTPKSVAQLGPAVAVSFLIRNSGPSRVPEMQLNILWPLNGTATTESNYYLYIASIKV